MELLSPNTSLVGMEIEALVGTGIQPVKKTRKAREVKRYKHPDTGEVVETKGGNNRTLKAWKQEHGSEMVEAWLES